MCVILAAMNLMHTHFKGGGNDEEQVRLAIAELHERVLAQQAKAESCNAMLDTYSPQLNKSLAALEKLTMQVKLAEHRSRHNAIAVPSGTVSRKSAAATTAGQYREPHEEHLAAHANTTIDAGIQLAKEAAKRKELELGRPDFCFSSSLC